MKQNTQELRRTRNPEAKRRAVLDAALKELSVHGFGGFRTEKVALLAGVSVGTIFKLFPDKKALANAVYTDCLSRIVGLLAPAFSPQVPVRESFDQMWKTYSDLYFRAPECLIFFEYQLTADFLSAQNRLGLEQLRAGLSVWIRHHQEKGVLKNNSIELLRALAIGAIMRVVRESLDGHMEVSKAKFLELKELVWESITTPAGRAASLPISRNLE